MSFLIFLPGLSAFGQGLNKLTVYAFRSSAPLDYATPRQLAFSLVKSFRNRRNPNAESSHFLGHLSVQIQCRATGLSPSFNALASISGGENDFATVMRSLSRGGGLDPVLATYKDGHFEDETVARNDIVQNAKRGGLRSLEFLISDEACLRAKSFHLEFKSKNYAKNFGLLLNPRKREGAGCSSYVMSVLEVAGMMTFDFRKNWVQTLRVPKAYFSGSSDLRPVRFAKTLGGLMAAPWATPQTPHIEIQYWEPTLIYSWIQKHSSAGQTQPGLRFYAQEASTPTEPIFVLP